MNSDWFSVVSEEASALHDNKTSAKKRHAVKVFLYVIGLC
ncbi:hypothetical protein ALT1000_140082 [Alteromonas macleodii]